MSKLVSVFVCGVQKGGTTSLDAYFCEHPQLSPPRKKEVHFFDRANQDWNAPNYSKLDAFYKSDDGDRLRFDITPEYIFWPSAIKYIKAYNPDAKLITLFRDPFERAWSNWCMVYGREKEELPFATAIREGRERLNNLSPTAHKRRLYSYIERGMYAGQVSRALEHFPSEQLLFLRSADFATNHVAVLAQISAFLGIATFPDTGPKREHKRSKIVGSIKPTAEDIEFVAGIVRDDVLEFSNLTGLPVSDWLVMRDPKASVSKARSTPKVVQSG